MRLMIVDIAHYIYAVNMGKQTNTHKHKQTHALSGQSDNIKNRSRELRQKSD